MAKRPRPPRRVRPAAPAPAEASGLDNPAVVDTALADPSTGGVVLVVQVPRPWDAADHARLKKKIAAYLNHIGDDGLSASSPDWPRGTTTIAIHAAETPPDAFAPLWDRYAFTLRAQYGLGFEVTVTHGANEAETIVESPGHAGTDVHGALRGGRAFAEHVLGRMREDAHFGTAELVDATSLHFTREGAGFDVSLDNAWRECRGKGPEALTKVVSKYLAAWSGAGAGEGEAAARLFPVLRPIARVAEIEALQQQHGALAAPEIHEPFSREIVLSYVLDSEQAMASLSPEEADELADSWDALHDLAVGNLFRHVKDSLQVHTLEEGIFMVAVGGHYESGLLCIAPVWRKLASTVPGDVVVAVPARDLLLFTGSDNEAAVRALAMRAQEFHDTNDHPIAPGLLRLGPQGWVDA